MIKLKIKYGNSQTDIRFPCTEKEMNAALERIHAEDVTPLELYVSEVVFPKELGCLQDRFVNLDEVNYLGKRMDSFFGDEEYQFYEAMKAEGFDTLPDLINLSFNLNRYPLIRDISDMGKIGREAYDDGRNVNMITAIIRNKENTLVLDLPHSIYDIYEKLQSIGIMQPPKQIPLTDNSQIISLRESESTTQAEQP